MLTSNSTSETVVLRAADDAAFFFKVYASTRQEELAPVPWTEPQKMAFLQMQFNAQDIHYRQNYPGAKFEVIYVGGQPAGRLYRHDRPRDIRIMDIALLPEYRGCGIGTALLEGIFREATQLHKTVSIHVELFNPALRLYQRLGFKKISEMGPYLLMEWSPVSATAQ